MADARVADMIGKIAHELRSPLTSVKGFSSMLLTRWDRFTDEQRLQFIETINADAERMSRIVTEVLDLARMEAGRLEIHPLAVEVGAVASKAAERVAELPGFERVTTDVPADLLAWADPDRLESVLTNILENALKFSQAGPINVVGRKESEGMIEIAVTDEGVGIERNRLDYVFAGPSPRVPKAATPKGSGLGLYLSKGLIEAHGGSISVTSEPGRGSTFTVSLPDGHRAA